MTINTLDNKFGVARWIVDPVSGLGTHTTIASALAAASSGETIFIRPGTYTENLTLKAGVNLVGFPQFRNEVVTILGTLTASYNGNVTLANLQLQTNGAAAIDISGSNASELTLMTCTLNANDDTALIADAPNFGVRLFTCRSFSAASNLIFDITDVAGITFYSCDLSEGTSMNTIAGGAVNLFSCTCSSFSITSSSTGDINAYDTFVDNSNNQTVFTYTGTSAGNIQGCHLFSGTASTISVGAGCSCSISDSSLSSSNANVVTGAGTVFLTGIAMPGTSSNINTTTQTARGLTFARTNSTGTITSDTFTTYEEGTFTPTITGKTSAGTTTYSQQIGRYTRLGRVVFIEASVIWTAATGTGVVILGGLPFTVNLNFAFYPASFYSSSFLIATATEIQPIFIASTNTLEIYGSIVNTGAQINSSLAANTNTNAYICGFYEI